jgi:hypothetical protein
MNFLKLDNLLVRYKEDIYKALAVRFEGRIK